MLVVGRGSNLLVSDAGFPGIAVSVAELAADIEVLDGGVVHAGGAVALPTLARRTAAAGLTGFEWAVGVPGSVGGAVRMNAGGHGSDMAACVLDVDVVDLRGRRPRQPRPGPSNGSGCGSAAPISTRHTSSWPCASACMPVTGRRRRR